ncbi:hypothetical protein DsansV1_C03g0032741 [Dioscorea sansibarensis]
MAAAKSPRSKFSVSSVQVSGSRHANGGVDRGASPLDKLEIFNSENFDSDAYVQSKCGSMTEKALIGGY